MSYDTNDNTIISNGCNHRAKICKQNEPTDLSIYHTDDGCAQAHAGNEAHVPMILTEHCARAGHYEHGGDVHVASPGQRVLRPNEGNQQTATIAGRIQDTCT